MPKLRHALLTTILVALVGSPIAAAGWAAFGNHEPDTQADVDDGFAYTKPYTGSENRVYFNGIFSSNDLNYASPTPNADGLGLVKSSATTKHGSLVAVLGVWSDCNKDGYVGLADQGLWEYRAEVLSSSALSGALSPECRPVPVRPTTDSGLAAWHNDGTWVRELIPIGWTQGCGHTEGTPDCTETPKDYNPYDINDNAARVWVDSGRPQDDTPGGAGGSCSLNPPTSSMHSTGGIIWWLGCGEGYAAIDLVNGITETAGAGKLVFGDVNDHRYFESGSPLNRKNPWGDQGDASYVKAWDCGSPQTFAPRDPTARQGQHGMLWRVDDPTYAPGKPGVAGDKDGHINVTSDDGYIIYGANVSAISTAPAPDAAGSPAGTVNQTAQGTTTCDRDSSPGGGRGGSIANAPYSLEQDIGTSQGVSKKTSSEAVLYTGYGTNEALVDAFMGGFGLTGTKSGGRGDQLHGNVFNRVNPPAATGQQPVHHEAGNTTVGVLGESAPLMLGTHLAANNGIWHDDIVHVEDFTSEYTFYGYVTPQPWLNFHGGVGIYGSDHCDNGVSLGNATWECDSSKWWRASGGVDNSWRSNFLGKDPSTESSAECVSTSVNVNTDSGSRGCYNVSPYPGALYDLKDQDCYDDTVATARDTGFTSPPVDVPDATGQGLGLHAQVSFCPVPHEASGN